MYGVIVATHGNYASGLKSTVNLVCGEMENLRTIDYVAEISVTDLENKYDEAMAELKAYDKIIILTLGMSHFVSGSPSRRRSPSRLLLRRPHRRFRTRSVYGAGGCSPHLYRARSAP